MKWTVRTNYLGKWIAINPEHCAGRFLDHVMASRSCTCPVYDSWDEAFEHAFDLAVPLIAPPVEVYG